MSPLIDDRSREDSSARQLKRSSFRVVSVITNRAVLDPLNGSIDDEYRDKEPHPWSHRIAEAVLDLNIEARGNAPLADVVHSALRR